MKLKYKIWFEIDGEPVITKLKYELLKNIEKTKSIKKASELLNISYKKALEHIKAMEKRLGKKIVVRERGKGAYLTKEGKKLMEMYERAKKEFEKTARLIEEKEGI
ncbi:winged helix-turn-helix domain-containing protein [Aquifex aeolicus]|uniref:winged helix-turn-helix domain-containing protein n=1 Tax=Aquifex aeolicus TaxID=63363 RepID=UPI0002FA76DD|nr:LysR family transcriptional regulator [Aquifex aeolicus]